MTAAWLNWPGLTVKTPWSWAVSDGPKRAENRGWHMSYHGPLWLHAGARSGWDPAGAHSPQVQRAWQRAGKTQPLTSRTTQMTFSAVTALVRVTGCHHWLDCPGSCAPWGAAGGYHITLGERVALLPRPVPCHGWLGLRPLAPDVRAAALEQLPRARWVSPADLPAVAYPLPHQLAFSGR